jgi:hypothetical protein
MNLFQHHQSELSKIREDLRKALSEQPEDCHRTIAQVIKRSERLSESIASVPAKLGSKGGRETAKRGSDYFRQLAAMRADRRPSSSASKKAAVKTQKAGE